MFSALFLCILCQVQEINPKQQYDIEIVTKKKDTYYLLVKGKPTEITVEGPTYLRIYTRIPWTDDAGKNQIYKLVLTENELDEQILTFESEKSTVSKDEKGRFLSKWRSFYIEVPEGTNIYQLQHWASPGDTILYKIAYESPRTWQEVPATESESDIINYHNRKDIIPSNARNIFVKLQNGSHDLGFTLEGSTASSAAIRFLI